MELEKIMHSIGNRFNKKQIKLNFPKAPTEQLYDAISEGNLDKTKNLLLNKEVDPNYINCLNYTPLMIAILKVSKSKDLVKILLENNADPNLKANGRITPIYLAVWLNKIDILEILIMYGAVLDFNYQDQYGLNLLEKARHLGHQKMENVLLKYFELQKKQKDDLLDSMLIKFKQSFNNVKPYQYYLSEFSSNIQLQQPKNRFSYNELTKEETQFMQTSSNNDRPDVLINLLKSKYSIA
jgi:ankyrin repeat protein